MDWFNRERARRQLRQIAAVLLLAPLAHAEPERPELRLVTGEWPPYSAEAMTEGGCLTQLVAEAVRRMGYRPRIDFRPWRRAQAEIIENRAFAAFPYATSPERELIFDFSDPIFPTRTVFFYDRAHYQGSADWKNLEELKPFRIGALLGSFFEPEFRNNGLAVEYVQSDSQNFMKLHANRVALVATDELQGWWTIEQLFPGERETFATLGSAYTSAPSRLMINRKHPYAQSLTRAFNQAFKTLQVDGSVDRHMRACIIDQNQRPSAG